jgi:neutral ceramidase
MLREVQVITLGNQIAWVGLLGEVFVELGISIKRASTYARTIVTEIESRP